MSEINVDAVGTILAVANVKESIAFYKDSLGFDVLSMFEDPDFAILGKGPARLCLAQEGVPADDRPGVQLFAPEDRGSLQVNLVLWVNDCRMTYETLRDIGVPFLGPPVSPPWGGARCFAVDPDGYLVEIEELP